MCTKELSAIYSVNQSAYSCRKPARKLWSFCGLNSVGPTPLPYKLEKQNSSYCLSALGAAGRNHYRKECNRGTAQIEKVES